MRCEEEGADGPHAEQDEEPAGFPRAAHAPTGWGDEGGKRMGGWGG